MLTFDNSIFLKAFLCNKLFLNLIRTVTKTKYIYLPIIITNIYRKENSFVNFFICSPNITFNNIMSIYGIYHRT